MNTRTYARLSLLIPLLLWVLSLLALLVDFVLFTDPLTTSETPNEPAAVVMVLLLCYVFGIFLWIIPYLVISLGLLFLSFISTEKVLKLVYFLAPIPMAAAMLIVGMALVIVPLQGAPISGELTSFQYSIVAGGLFAFITLICGYICVGLGFGGFMLMQFFGMIIGQEKAHPETKNFNSQSLQQELS